MWYQGADNRVPLIQDAELGAWIGDRLVTLADLEDITEGTRQPPGGDALVVRGRAAGIYLEAEFALETATVAAPRGAVTLRFYPDRELPTIRGVRFADLGEPTVVPGAAPLVAVVNGFQSGGGVRVQRVTPTMPAATSHAISAVTRGTIGLGLSFDAGEPGDGRVRYEKGRLEAASEWRPARPLFPQGDAATLRICCDPAGDGLSALRALLTPASLVDQELIAATAAPVGWSTRSELAGRVTEDDVVANLELAARTFDRSQFRLIHLDDGYERAAGDWEMNSRFPHGHRWLTDRIHAQGLQAGLWLAPFAVGESSRMPAANPGWLLRRERTPIVFATRDLWGGRVFALDGAHRGVQEWLFELGRRVVRDWGYDYVQADLLEWACEGDAYAGGLTRAEAYRRGLAAFRDGLGADTFLSGAAAPLQHAAGLVSGLRVGPDVVPTWGGLQSPARAAGLRSFYHRATWVNDPDSLVARAPLELSEARVWTTLVALSGGATMLGDDLTKLPAERLALLRRAIPPIARGGRPVNAVREDIDVPPAIVTDSAVQPRSDTATQDTATQDTATQGVLPITTVDRPADTWVTEGRDGWWTIGLFNWDDTAREIALAPAAAELRGTRFHAYDVWNEQPLPDVTTSLEVEVPGRDVVVVALRPASTSRAQVLATSRHVVQGAVDILEEKWDQATRTLQVRSGKLDGRPYTVTISVPRGSVPGPCTADVPCTTRRLPGGQLVLEWAATETVQDFGWSVKFPAAGGKRR